MPILTLQVTRLPSSDLADRLASTLTDLTNRLLGKRPELTALTLTEIDPQRWYIGAQPLGDAGPASFFLDIRVTLGTNTKDEKAAYVDQVFAALQSLLGPLSPVSYVVVHEVAADAWGYGGQTQEHRYVQRQRL